MGLRWLHVCVGRPGEGGEQDAVRAQALPLCYREWQRAGHMGAYAHPLLARGQIGKACYRHGKGIEM